MVTKKYSIFIFLIFAYLWASLLNPAWSFSTKNGNIFDSNGNQISIDGVAWIGFQDSNFLGGLWNVPFNPMGAQHGVIELLKAPWNVPGSNITLQSVGVSFKSIRLAMQPGIWHNVTGVQQSPFSFTATDINNPIAGNGPFCDWSKGSDGSGHCVQSKTAPDLLTTTINEFNKQDILVMLDFHHRPGLGDNFRDGTVVASDYTLKMYHDDIVNFVKTAPANVLGVDIYNEPHQLFWFQDNTQVTPTQPSWIKVIAAAASAIYDTNKNVLVFVEGPGGTQGNDPFDPVFNLSTPICLPASTKVDNTSVIGLTTDPDRCPTSVNPLRVTNIGVNWGENFRSLLDTTQTANGIAKFDVTKFRNMLIQAIVANNFSATDPNLIADWLLGPNNDGNDGHLVFAPHLYGSQVAGWQSDANDSQIRFKWNFGFLLDSGFPFVVGELGYDVQVGGQDFFLDSVAPYLISRKINHNLFFWTWNQADYPVGIRSDDSGLTLFAWKELDLHNLFSAIMPPQDVGKLCITVPAPTGYTGTAFPIVIANGSNNTYAFNLVSFDKLTCFNDVAIGTYSLSGNTIFNTNGISFIPSQVYSATVTKDTETDVTVTYVQAPTGTLQVSVTGDVNCPISANQQVTVSYTNDSTTHQLQVLGPTSVSTTVPVGSYTIVVSPDPLSTNQQCHPQYNKTINIAASNTTEENINYVFTQVGNCTINAQCSTWGTSQDPWAGSSCNFYINILDGMTDPAIFKMAALGISSLTNIWNATGSISNGYVVLTLSNAVNVTNIGFNATGIIALPPSATMRTKGQTFTCPITKL